VAAKKKEPKVSKFQRSQIETEALRDYVPKEMRALFDHLISLAKHSHSAGYPKRAGQELAHARKLAKKPDAQDLSPAKWQVHFQSAAQHARDPNAWSVHSEIYSKKPSAEAHAARIRAAEPGMRAKVVFV